MRTWLGGLVLALSASSGWAAPEPSLVPRSWQVSLEFRDPARIVVTLPGDRHPTVFWYLVYTVTNRTDREVAFYPQFELVTDTLQVVPAGDGVSLRVFDAVRQRHRKQYPFIMSPLKVAGKLLRGEDNARTSVAIFRDFDLTANRFTIYVAGLSGEITRVTNPAFDASRPKGVENPQFFTLRKTLAFVYDLPGDVGSRAQADPVRVRRKWIMR